RKGSIEHEASFPCDFIKDSGNVVVVKNESSREKPMVETAETRVYINGVEQTLNLTPFHLPDGSFRSILIKF
ncbi:MAG: hypothetical protein ACO31Z_04125, partial [Litorivicinaceae bacterium]